MVDVHKAHMSVPTPTVYTILHTQLNRQEDLCSAANCLRQLGETMVGGRVRAVLLCWWHSVGGTYMLMFAASK